MMIESYFNCRAINGSAHHVYKSYPSIYARTYKVIINRLNFSTNLECHWVTIHMQQASHTISYMSTSCLPENKAFEANFA